MTDEKEIAKSRAFVISKIKWSSPNKHPTGGQTVSRVERGATLISDEIGFEVTITGQRTQLKCKELAYILFELALDEWINN